MPTTPPAAPSAQRAGTEPLAPRSAPPARPRVVPTGVERRFADDEIIVSKTDLAGRITYANDVFMRVSGYGRAELMGAPHSLIRHPAMPRAVFELLWRRLEGGHEVFAYVVNMARNGDHYWVLAHVTPTVGPDGRTVSYHSNRRTPDRRVLPAVEALYAQLLAAEQAIERAGGLKRDAIAASTALLTTVLAERGMTYDEFVWSL